MQAEPLKSVYTGTLDDMISEAYHYCKGNIDPDLWGRGKEGTCWLEYRGNACAPFRAYMRFRHDRIIISNIFAVASDEPASPRAGRMPHILRAAATIHKRVVVESVINKELAAYLVAVGFTQVPDNPGNFEKIFG